MWQRFPTRRSAVDASANSGIRPAGPDCAHPRKTSKSVSRCKHYLLSFAVQFSTIDMSWFSVLLTGVFIRGQLHHR
jgi:hypothetical protein